MRTVVEGGGGALNFGDEVDGRGGGRLVGREGGAGKINPGCRGTEDGSDLLCCFTDPASRCLN